MYKINVDDEEVVTEETTPETTEETTEESDEESEESTNIDYEAELEKAKEKETSKEKPDEREKARKALFFNAERAKELGIDPAEVLGIKPKVEKKGEIDIDTVVDKKFIERDVRSMCGSDAEYNLTMFYVNKGLSPEDAHLLANKGKIKRAVDEAKRGNVTFGKADNGTRIVTEIVPKKSPEEVNLLARRGLTFNPKTKTYQGKYTEEYYDRDSKSWKSRKL